VWLFDNKVLRAAGEREGLDLTPRGVIHDTLAMFHHWQPDLPAHLQFAASFVQFPFPWKHLAGSHIEFYGCADADATLRLYGMLSRTLQRDGIYGDEHTGYLGQVFSVRPVLAAMEDRGMPIDDAARVALGAEFERAQVAMGEELSLAAGDIGNVHPKQGYVRVPKDLTGLVERDFEEIADDLTVTQVRRWCRVDPFNPNSPTQLIKYMRAKGHEVPKSRKNEDADGNAKDTTEKKELERLAKKTADTFYLRVIEYRELGKMRGTYIEGFVPGADGRVHTTFTFDTGTGQLAARNPNVTNFPKRMRLAKQVRKMVAAPPGHVLVEWDYKSYHVVTTGFCAEDPSYIRLAKIDMHSFVAWHLLKLPGADELISLPDEELAAQLKWFKSDERRKWVRDNQAKPAILGIGFGMGYRRLYQENLEYFDGEREAKRLHSLLKALFPRVFAWQDRVRKQAHEQQYLKSAFGHVRRFYEVYRWDSAKHDYAPGDQAEEAIAFLPANIAFGNIRETMKELARLKFDDLYGLVNSVHDSFLFCLPGTFIGQHVQDVYPVLTAPSKILRHPTICPDGLVIDVEGAVGHDWGDMKEIKICKQDAVLS